MEKGKGIKFFRNLILFLGLICLTFYIIFKDQDPNDFFNILKNANLNYITFGILSMCAFLSLEAINVKRMLKALRRKDYFF